MTQQPQPQQPLIVTSLKKICYFAEENNALDCVAVRLADTTLNLNYSTLILVDTSHRINWDLDLCLGRWTFGAFGSCRPALLRCLAAKLTGTDRSILETRQDLKALKTTVACWRKGTRPLSPLSLAQSQFECWPSVDKGPLTGEYFITLRDSFIETFQ